MGASRVLGALGSRVWGCFGFGVLGGVNGV